MEKKKRSQADLDAFFFLEQKLVFPLQQNMLGLELSWSDVVSYNGGRAWTHAWSHLHFHLAQLLRNKKKQEVIN